RRLKYRHPGQRHAQKDSNIDSEDYLGDRAAARATDPRRRHDPLYRVVRYLAPLCSLILHTPLADLLAEGKSRHVAAALCALCHKRVESICSLPRLSLCCEENVAIGFCR